MKRFAHFFPILCVISLLVTACAPVATMAPAVAQPSPVSTNTPSPTPSLTPANTLSPTPTNTPPLLVIKINLAYLRSGPNVGFPIISDGYPKGTKMEILCVYQDWFYVKASTNGKIGWLYTSWVNLDSSIDLSAITTPACVPIPPTARAYPNP